MSKNIYQILSLRDIQFPMAMAQWNRVREGVKSSLRLQLTQQLWDDVDFLTVECKHIVRDKILDCLKDEKSRFTIS